MSFPGAFARDELTVFEVRNVWFESPGASFDYPGDPERPAGSRSPESWSSWGDPSSRIV